jgi:hypothetical protein
MKDDPGVGTDVVIVVLDQNAGDDIIELAGWAHVWVCASELNRQAVRAVWAQGDESCGATIFKIDQRQSTEEQFLSMVDEIELHHPRWLVMNVRGVKPTSEVVAAIRNAGGFDHNVEIEDVDDGFIAKRTVNQLAQR